MRTKTVRVEPMRMQGHAGHLIRTPYDEGFVRQLKEHVPFTDRVFFERRAGWWISERYADVIIHLARETFGGAEVRDASGETVVHTAGGERCKQELLL